MNPLSPSDILTVWEQGHVRVPFEKALLLAGFARPDTSTEELADLPVVERDLAILDLRERTLGPRLNAFATCPACQQELEFPLETQEIREKIPLPAAPAETTIGELRVRLRLPSSSDLARLDRETGDPAAARLALAARCIEAVECDGLTAEVQGLPKQDLSRLADYLDDLGEQAEIQIKLTCPACSHSWQAAFDIASYFYTELTVLARRLLEEVHILASAYGWSERDILAMAPARRHFYLEKAR